MTKNIADGHLPLSRCKIDIHAVTACVANYLYILLKNK